MSEKQYRDLEALRDVLEVGDLMFSPWHKDEWLPIDPAAAGCIVRLPGMYRRPIASSPEGETLPRKAKELDDEIRQYAEESLKGCLTESSPTTEPVVTEKHRRCAAECVDEPMIDAVAATIAEHFPEPASDWIERAAELDKTLDEISEAQASQDHKPCTCYTDPEGPCEYCNVGIKIFKLVDKAKGLLASHARHMKGEGA
jgi:hypothetical protein